MQNNTSAPAGSVGLFHCPHCSSLTDPSSLCPVCGCPFEIVSGNGSSLPFGSVVMNRYILGGAFDSTDETITYDAFDRIEKKSVSVVEYFPKDVVHRVSGAAMVKVLRGSDEPGFRQGAAAFLERAKQLTTLKAHENLVAFYNAFTENGTSYCVKEYVDGVSVRECIFRKGAFAPGDVFDLALALSSAVALLNANGIFPVGFDPASVFLLKDGSIRLSLDPAGQTDEWFLSPERRTLGAAPDSCGNVYCVSAVLYMAATGNPPQPDAGGFSAGVFPERVDLQPLEQLILQGLDPDRSARLPSAEALEKKLVSPPVSLLTDTDNDQPLYYFSGFAEKAAVNEDRSEKIVKKKPPERPSQLKRRVAAVLIVVSVLVLLAAIFLLVMDVRSDKQQADAAAVRSSSVMTADGDPSPGA